MGDRSPGRLPDPGLRPDVGATAPPHQIRLVHGIPATCPERTILDLCGSVHPQRAERALDNALAADLTTAQHLGLMLAETGARGRPGTAELRRLLAVRTADYVPPASELEALLLAVLDGAGVARPTGSNGWEAPQHPPAGSISSTGQTRS